MAPDGTSTTFLRHLVHDCDGAVTATTDTTTDGVTAYTPAGTVGECAPCEPVAMCPQLLGLSGPETWNMPPGTESVSITVLCGPVTVTDCTGAATVINECGTAFSWSAPSTNSCEPGRLCDPFTVDLPEGATAYIQWLSPCASGDES
ncbi:hypothetical protein ACFVXE_08505 [Streptomyces sp. NPDC058231]|uniref:hypothetical protein n=1 Tax=Streptomyces sp. NPDC058231 TaxID=3346392 RepID=UPI0036EF263C